MSCILTHQPVSIKLLSQRYTSLNQHDIIDSVPKKSSLKSLYALIVPNLKQQDRTSSNKLVGGGSFPRHSNPVSKDFEENSRRRELLLDNSGSLHRRMEEYRRQTKTGRYIHIFDTGDSDDEEDLE